jgi:hypothetical protein
MEALKYPFSYDEWLAHPSTKPKLKAIKEDCERWRIEKKNGEQLELF